MDEFITLDVPEHTSGRLDKTIADLYPELSRSRLKNLILNGYLVVDGETATDVSLKIKGGETLELTIPPLEEGDPQPENIPLDIVYEDDDLLVINKQAGLVVHPAPGNWQGTMVNALLYHCGESLSGIGGVKRPGIVHRLDKETSGLMVVAKTDRAHQGLTAQFADRSLSRRYLALVWGLPKTSAALLETKMGRSKTNRKKMAVQREHGKDAITHYQVQEVYGLTAALMECQLETGRTHQIRVHMSHIGHPVIGDIIYGKRPRHISQAFENEVLRIFPQDRHLLHAFHIEFIHPVTKELMEFEVDLPSDMLKVQAFLKEKLKIS
ncbi:MAG: RluA family pseudouridine synthase [Alphaproteobacteria bacterium]|nr:RluA family pseudouridine synthase [Alphaproteobacteria bacterium]